MNRNSSPVADDTIACEAMDWFLRNREGPLDEAGRVAFLDWMKRSPEHVRAYMRALALHRQVGEALQSPLADEAAVPPRQIAAKVVPLFGSVHAPPRAVPRRGRARWWVAAAAACITLLGVGLVPQVAPTEQLYSAGQGELRDLVLPDQTQVRLNADSRLRVRMGWFSRKVELLQGEATFDIARDRRPFEVQVNGLEIRDIGTVFDVSRRLQSTRIGVVSGEVEVWSQGADARRLAQLGEGRVVQVDARSHAVESLDLPLSMLLDWQQRKVSFLDERLDEVAAAFNRHNQVQVRVLDEGAASARLSGSLDAHRIGALQAFLERDPRFVVKREGGTVRVGSR
ncbi:FecR domain-containing protein [Stenotrophomonas sp. GD03908]|uniref:FecR domain-containing protein n=1 Tax=Stenotrophomonas maltophilia TaxID=40324 RepID=A0AAJ2TTF6_STEMA|nr:MULTISPECIES: FecR domain-containing protein [Stenotrophomonas]MBH1482274.1 FecR domain-containing protein [Stenotrophomonas maltophilia]MCU1065482.1 FecR domain-containing protein [Stenotrophomonas maltophilia]MDH0977674.1 FecR domain-containing protein [Stenotrophomonas sp. GD03908]MDQ7295375.1 FecR domain-containing protein [Stenotrophomonas sp. Sm0041]MDZ5766682.1 FecR domain-containing protein [Stenotrophomonas maltophilia]